MIIPSGIFDEGNSTSNGSKVLSMKKETASMRSSNPTSLPLHPSLINVHSSTSSIDSTGAKNLTQPESQSLPPVTLTVTTSTTTTDSEDESEQDNDDSSQQLLKSNDLSPASSTRQPTPKSTPSKAEEQLSRRVKHFRKLFKTEIPGSMPELIDSYVCAYQGNSSFRLGSSLINC